MASMSFNEWLVDLEQVAMCRLMGRARTDGDRVRVHVFNDLPQPEPPESPSSTKPESGESPPAVENRRAGGCWLQGAA